MLAKANKLQKKKSFEKVFRNGRGFKESFLFMKVVENKLETSRFGFVVSHKFSKKATVRNKIRRKIREEVRSRLPFIKEGFDIVLIVHPQREENVFSKMVEVIDKLFRKAKIVK